MTGAHGFAGRHLVAALRERGWSVSAPPRSALDLLNRHAVDGWLARERPRYVFHLAAFASVARSWEMPEPALLDNVRMTLHLLQAVEAQVPTARVLVASSAEIYGPPQRLPVGEGHPLAPQSPYALGKVGVDLLAGQFASARGLRVVRARSFNHAGPGQSATYVIGSITRQIALARIEGSAIARVQTGDPSAARDFTDVRDVVGAYVSAADIEPGAYNVASGRAVSVRDILNLAERVAGCPIQHVVDEALARPADVPRVQGDAGLLRRLTGWTPRLSLQDTLRDAVGEWERVLAKQPPPR